MKYIQKHIITLLTLLFLLLGGFTSKLWSAWTGSGEGVLKNGNYYALYETTTYTRGWISGAGTIHTYTLSAPNSGTLYFSAKTSLATTTNAKTITIEQCVNGSWSSAGSKTINTSHQQYSISINSEATEVRFKVGGAYDREVKNVYVAMAQYVSKPSTTSLDCGTKDINTGTTSNTFTVAWCNVPAMTYEITGTDKDLFSVSVENNAAAGKYNTATFTVTCDHNKRAGDHSATLTISDTYGSYSKTVSLSGATNKLTPTITWLPDEAIFNVTDVLSATNANGLTVTLSSAGNESYVYCSGNTATMLLSKASSITISADVTGNNIYKDTTYTKEITITELTKQYITWDQDFSR